MASQSRSNQPQVENLYRRVGVFFLMHLLYDISSDHATNMPESCRTTIPRPALQSIPKHPAISTTLEGVSTMTGVQAKNGFVGTEFDAVLPTGVILTPSHRRKLGETLWVGVRCKGYNFLLPSR